MINEDSGLLNYLISGIEEKYKNKKGLLLKSKPQKLEKLLRLGYYNISKMAEVIVFRTIPLFTSILGIYAISIREYKLATYSFSLAALIVGTDIYRYSSGKKTKRI